MIYSIILKNHAKNDENYKITGRDIRYFPVGCRFFCVRDGGGVGHLESSSGREQESRTSGLSDPRWLHGVVAGSTRG